MRIVVSLAAVSFRMRTLGAVLKTILNQSLRPERVLVWVSESPYLLDNGIPPGSLPDEVSELANDKSNGLEIRYTDNTGPHRKMVPVLEALRGEPDPPLIVTADDDTLYPKRWLEALWDGYTRYNSAVAFRARRMVFEGSGILPYKDWPLLTPFSEEVGLRLLSTGNLGLLVDPAMLDSRILDPSLLQVSPSRSDAWIAAALMAKGTRLAKLSFSRVFPDESGIEIVNNEFPRLGQLEAQSRDATHSELYLLNEEQNDAIIRRTFEFFGVLP